LNKPRAVEREVKKKVARIGKFLLEALELMDDELSRYRWRSSGSPRRLSVWFEHA
jgi:hypothetical protein